MKVQFTPGFSLSASSTMHYNIKKNQNAKDSKIQALFTHAASHTLVEALTEIKQDSRIKELWEQVEKIYGAITFQCVPSSQAPLGSYFEYDFSISDNATSRKVARVSKPVICIADNLDKGNIQLKIADALFNLAHSE